MFFIGITLLFLGLASPLGKWIGWMPKIQFLPAVLALNVGVIVGLIILTFVFGRIYCSVVCPLGLWQDIVSWTSGKRKGKKMRFSFSPEKKWLRYTVWTLYVIAIIAGVQVVVALIAPYSTYGRFVSNLTGIKGWPAFVAAILVMIIVTVLAWIGGRTWCNAICPVGTTLSFFSRFALFRPVIDRGKCKSCKVCERKCKSQCINIKEHKIDYSRCVDCFDCLDNCRFDAMHYRFAYAGGQTGGQAKKATEQKAAESHPKAKTDSKNSSAPERQATDTSRRAFLASTAMIASALTVGAQQKKASEALSAAADTTDDKKRDGGLADIIPKQEPERSCPLTPFGSRSVKDFYSRCTACQLCVANCPNHVLKPSSDLEHFMQPHMSYVSGYCRPECTECSQVCPAGAINPITPEEKTSWHIGTATVDYDRCVVNRDGVKCGNCTRHCPVGAIIMVKKDPDDKDSLRIPTVNEARCIGCGACEYLCPSRPISAIHVNGREVHPNDED